MVSDLLSRKFIIGMLLIILSFILVITNHINSKEWLGFVGIVGATYFTANIAEKKL